MGPKMWDLSLKFSREGYLEEVRKTDFAGQKLKSTSQKQPDV